MASGSRGVMLRAESRGVLAVLEGGRAGSLRRGTMGGRALPAPAHERAVSHRSRGFNLHKPASLLLPAACSDSHHPDAALAGCRASWHTSVLQPSELCGRGCHCRQHAWQLCAGGMHCLDAAAIGNERGSSSPGSRWCRQPGRCAAGLQCPGWRPRTQQGACRGLCRGRSQGCRAHHACA